MGKQGKILSSDNFYDSVAPEYNSHMTDADASIRQIVSDAFKKNVRKGNVLDFGGGTGLDMRWLTNQKEYKVFFLEPSENMRLLAKKLSEQLPGKPYFIEHNIDFHAWAASHLPVPEKMDGILANFAVLNCIKDIELLFEKLALISNEGCYVMATVIDSRPKALIKQYKLPIVLRSIFNMKGVVYSNYHNTGHKTYLHTIAHYKKASEKYFNFDSYTPLGFSNMALLILSKK
jgi:ubiquinone/menaquinone biosynthesis C-methylase UbiE